MTEAEHLDFFARLVALVQRAIERPTMYFGRPSVDAVQGFCTGIDCAIVAFGENLAFGEKLSLALRREATQSRGWQFTSTGGLDLMRERGLSEEQIAEELLHIQIALLNLVARGSAGEV